MEHITTIIILLTVVTALAEVTDRIGIPYPILLVLVGIGVGMVPGLPEITLDPEIVFLIFLPPLLYSEAWITSWPDFKAARRPILLLAIGCVIFTTCAVAYIAHTFIPGFGWPEAFVLGAIVSPPDAVAATAAIKGLKIPKRVVTILEGESLVNDATGLIAYRFAVAAVVSGMFHLGQAGLWFTIVAAGGIAIGFAVGFCFKWIHKITPDNPATDTSFTFLTPYVAYLAAEELQVSGVLAVVTAGLIIGRSSSEIFSQQARLQARGAWNTAIFLLNGIVFILIGLQLPSILGNIEDHSFGTLLFYGSIVSLAAIIGRIIWVYPGAYIPRWLSADIRRREPDTNLRAVTVVAWSGMRGVVSLAAALALPYMVYTTDPFPHRDLIIFLTFAVIFSTLVLQGLTLRPLIKKLGLRSDGSVIKAGQEARVRIAGKMIETIEEGYSLTLNADVLNQIKSKYEIRIQRLHRDWINGKLKEEDMKQFLAVQQELLTMERRLLITMRKEGRIDDEALRDIEYELDLEEARLLLETREFSS